MCSPILLRGGGEAEQARLLELVTSLVQNSRVVPLMRRRLGERRVFDLWGDCWMMDFPGADVFYYSVALTTEEARAVRLICMGATGRTS